jgi:hypothetical protein
MTDIPQTLTSIIWDSEKTLPIVDEMGCSGYVLIWTEHSPEPAMGYLWEDRCDDGSHLQWNTEHGTAETEGTFWMVVPKYNETTRRVE